MTDNTRKLLHENERRAWRAVALAAATPTEDPTT
jgi:hypothetical protein